MFCWGFLLTVVNLVELNINSRLLTLTLCVVISVLHIMFKATSRLNEQGILARLTKSQL